MAYVKVKYEPRACERPACRHTFTPIRRDQRFCSRLCQSRHHAYRHLLDAPRGR